MKHASLSQSVGVIKRYKQKSNLIPGQRFADHITGERGREAIISPMNFHVETPTEVTATSSAASSSSNAASSSTADAAKAILDPANTIKPSAHTVFVQYTEMIQKSENPHFSVPFANLFSSYVQLRHGEVRSLLEHPDAPAPHDFLERVCTVSYPSFTCFRDVINSELERGDRHLGNGSVRIWHLYKRCEHLHGPVSDATFELVDLMLRALVSVSAIDAAFEALDRIPNEYIRPQTWDILLVAIAKRKIRSAELLWRLVGPDSFHVLPTTGQYGLSAEFATVLLTRTRVQNFSFAPPMVGKAIMTRYFQFCAATQIPLHPTPFLFFFKLIRDARAGSDSTLFHWHIVWEYFQKLNAECPGWYERFPDEAEQLCGFLVDIMIRGADPWMVLNVSRSIASRRIMDGFDLSLRILRRLEPYQHHPAETKAVAKKLFTWLLDVVQIHLNPQYQHQVIPAMQALIRLGMLSELSRFHNHLLDHVTSLPESFKRDFIAAFEDILCSSCNSLLESADTSVDRQCPYCQAVKVAKHTASYSSSSAMSTSSNLVLLDSAAETFAEPIPSVLDASVIDISASVHAAEKEQAAAVSLSKKSTHEAALAAVSHSHKVSQGVSDDSLGLFTVRKSPKPANDMLPQFGASTKAMWQHAQAKRQDETRKMQGFIEKLQREQPTRQGFIDLAKSRLPIGGVSRGGVLQQQPAQAAPDATKLEEGTFVPAIEDEGPEALRKKTENDVRSALEDANSRAELQMQAKRLTLQEPSGMSCGAAVIDAGVQTTTCQPKIARVLTTMQRNVAQHKRCADHFITIS